VLGTTTAVVKQRAHRAYEHLRVAIGAAGWHPHSVASSGQLGRQVSTRSVSREHNHNNVTERILRRIQDRQRL
jgi:hypothetical protein